MSIYTLEGQPVITRLLKLANTWTAAQDFDAAITVQDDGLKIENPAATYAYTITGGAITAARQLNLPVTTGTDTLMTLGLAQTMSASLTFADDIHLRLGTTADQVFLNRSTSLTADTALTGVLVGTTVGSRQALAANSLIISNITASGNIGLYVNRNDVSYEALSVATGAAVVYAGISLVGGTNQVQVEHRDTTNTASHAALVVKANNTSADAYVSVQTAATQWYMGVDNNDSDSFKIGTGTAVGTNTLLTMSTAGLLTLAGSVNFGATNPSIYASSAGVERSLTHDITIGAGGAANAVVQLPFQLDTVTEAGLLGETDGSGSYTQLKTVWKIPYADAGAGTIGPTAPTTAATWNGGLFLGASNAVANGRLYWYANEGAHYVDATAGFNFLHKEPTTFGDFNNWKYGDMMVLKVDRYTEDGGHALPYPLEEGLRETLLKLLDTDIEFRQQVKEKLYA